MFGSEILEVGIGLAFLFSFAALTCSAVREGVEAFFKTRANNLESWLRENLTKNQDGEVATRGGDVIVASSAGSADEKKTLAHFYEHSLIYPLFSGTYDKATGRFVSGLPSYIPSKHFAETILDLLAPADGKPRKDLSALTDAANELQNTRLKNVVLRAVQDADNDLNRARASIEAWYDQSMERLSGYYKRWTQLILFCLGILVAASLNIDAIAVSRQLLHDKAMRTAVVNEAVRVQGQNADDTDRTIKALATHIVSTGIPMGYGRPNSVPDWPPNDAATFSAWSLKFAGWLVTGFAIMLGAPFWFDLLNKLVSLRSSQKPAQADGKKSAQPETDGKKPAPAAAPAPG